MDPIDRAHFASAVSKIDADPLGLTDAEVEVLRYFGSPVLLKRAAVAAEKAVSTPAVSTPPPPARDAAKVAADAEATATAIVELVQAAIAPIVEDVRKLRAELAVLRVDHADVKARLAGLDAGDTAAPMAGATLQ